MGKLAKLPPRIGTLGRGLSALPDDQGKGRWDGNGSRHQRGYGTAWDKLRLRILKRDCYLCQECKRQGRLTPLKVRPRDHAVDHIVPKAHGGTDDEANLESLCASCHSAKTAREWMG